MSLGPESGALLVLLLLAGAAAASDIRAMIIPDAVNLLILATGLGASLLLGTVEPASALAGALLGGGLLLGVRTAFRSRRGYHGLGLGDVKFVAAAGTWTGLEGLAPMLLLASLTALAYMGGRRLLDPGFDTGRRIPFGPFLALGTAGIAVLQIGTGTSVLDLIDRALGA
ncbi:leader peptidase (prepilin peptidase)/N-methyltransferase [Methylobacterium sp. BE186]|uniref:A24 family peptidase n=1 Tax=Methylobacterium sp. BE186 TaxID=2817715 RepID=UPI0028598C8D|nr:A24 family peptidase [Methylobacterium sp. BE186]MDR7039566.1 leader peptidase (prepilin peptidase)/N-methyltransferase [Methylobacterium sp. BE186]